MTKQDIINYYEARFNTFSTENEDAFQEACEALDAEIFELCAEHGMTTEEECEIEEAIGY